MFVDDISDLEFFPEGDDDDDGTDTNFFIFRHNASDKDVDDAVSVIVYNVAGDIRAEEDTANAQNNGTVGGELLVEDKF